METHSPSEFYEKFTSLLSEITSLVIVSHKSPDDDSISSVLTLYGFLTTAFPSIQVDIIYSGEKEERWSYFENFEKIKFLNESAINFESYEMIVGVDADQYSRFVSDVSHFERFKGSIVFIDHHSNVPDTNTLSLVLPTYPACSQLLYDIFYSERKFSSQRQPETILLGILGDTGNFRYIKPHQASTFLVTERLVREGNFDVQDLISRYSGYSEKNILVIQEFVRTMQFEEIEGWPRFMYSSLSRDFIEKNSLSDSEISSGSGIFVGQYGATIKECPWSLVFSARNDGIVSCSMRSRPGSVNVRLLGQEMGLGGGHDRAGGIKFQGSVDSPAQIADCVERLFSWMRTHKPSLS